MSKHYTSEDTANLNKLITQLDSTDSELVLQLFTACAVVLLIRCKLGNPQNSSKVSKVGRKLCATIKNLAVKVIKQPIIT